jgi:hypothetical protein
MRIVYRPLVALACRHSFFESGLARPLAMTPTAGCRRLMAQRRLLLRGEPAGGVVHAGRDAAGLLAAGLDPATPLVFALVADDPCFPAYTATDWAPGLVVCYSNRPEPPADPAAPGERVLVGATLALKTRAFVHRFAAPRRAATVAVLRAADGTTVYAAPAPAGAFETLALDLAALAEGRYDLRLDGEAALAFYLVEAASPGLWGVVELYGLGALAAAGAAEPLRYVIALEARATIWRYVILGAAGATLAVAGEIAAQSPGAAATRPAPRRPVAFSGPTPMALGPLAGAAFDSAAPIALCERPAGRYAMNLTLRRSPADGTTTLALPCAGRDTPLLGGAGAGVSQMVMSL